MKRVFPIIAVLLMMSCDKEKVLPVPTTKGKNTFGYVFQDSIIVGGDCDSNDSVNYDFDKSQFKFILKDQRRVYYSYRLWRILEIYLNFENYNNYHLDSAVYYENTAKSGYDPGPISEANSSVYRLDLSANNKVKITAINDEKRFIAGYFSFDLKVDASMVGSNFIDTSSVVTITEGRFDLKY